MATKKRRKRSASILPVKTLQLPVALVVMGLTMIGASIYVGHSNAQTTSFTTGNGQETTSQTTGNGQETTSHTVGAGQTGNASDNSDNTSDTTKKKVTACNHYVKVPNLNGSNGKPKDKEMNFVLNSTGQGGTVTVTGKAGAGCVGKRSILAVYKASTPPTTANSIQIQKKQVLFSSAAATMTKQQFTMRANIPNCYYQMDVAFRKDAPGQPLTTAEKAQGKTYHGVGGFTWGLRGGKNSCNGNPPPPPPPPTCGQTNTCPTPSPNCDQTNTCPTPPANSNETPVKEVTPILPDTGDNNLTLLGLVFIAAGLSLALYRRRQLTGGKRRR